MFRDWDVQDFLLASLVAYAAGLFVAGFAVGAFLVWVL